MKKRLLAVPAAGLMALGVVAMASAYDVWGPTTKTSGGCTTDVYAIAYASPDTPLSYAEHSDQSGTCANNVAAKAFWYAGGGWNETSWDIDGSIAAAFQQPASLSSAKGQYQTQVGGVWGAITQSAILVP